MWKMAKWVWLETGYFRMGQTGLCSDEPRTSQNGSYTFYWAIFCFHKELHVKYYLKNLAAIVL